MLKKIKKIVEKNPMALASVGENKKPRVIAIADIKVLSDNELLIGDNYMRYTKKNIIENNKVCLVVWDNSAGNNAEGYQLEGVAIYHDSGKWLEKVKKIHGNNAKGAIIVRLNKINKLLG